MPGRARLHAHRARCATTACSVPRTTAVHATHLTERGHRRPARHRHRRLLLSHHRTRSRRRRRTGARPDRRAGSVQPGLRQPRRDRHARGGPRRRARRTPGPTRARRPGRGRGCWTPPPPTGIARWAGPTPARFGSARGPTSWPRPRRRCAPRAAAPPSRTSCSPAPQPMSPTWWSTDVTVVADRHPLDIPDIGRSAGSGDRRGDGRTPMSTLYDATSPNSSPTTRPWATASPLGIVTDAAIVVDDGADRVGRPARRRRPTPTSASTSAGARVHPRIRRQPCASGVRR